MSTSIRLHPLTFLYTILTYLPITQSISTNTSRPSVLLFICVDDLGWNDVSFHNGSDFTTPNIDHLATNLGFRLNHYYVQSSCAPTRAAFLSGRYPIHTGMQQADLLPHDTYALPLHFTLLSEDLSNNGYDTYLFGKWHLGYFHDSYTPTFRGFNSFYGYFNEFENYINHSVSAQSTVDNQSQSYHGYDLWNNTHPIIDERHSTYIYGNKTIDTLYEYKSDSDPMKDPLFIYLSLQNVHSPSHRQVPKFQLNRVAHINDIDRRHKAANVLMVDDLMGTLVDELETLDLWNDTLIIFTTDNGAPSGDGGSNYPLRGSAGTLWEGGIRGTAFISGGYLSTLNASRIGAVTDEWMHVIDWYPTICHIVGITPTADDLDGTSFYQVITVGDYTAGEHRWLLLDLDINSVGCNGSKFCGALRWDDWKLVSGSSLFGYDTFHDSDSSDDSNTLCGSTWCSNMDTDYYTLDASTTSVYCPNVVASTELWNRSTLEKQCGFNGTPCLFNMLTDPCEFHDKYAQHSATVDVMKRKAKEFMNTALDALRTLNEPDDPSLILQNGFWSPWRNSTEMITSWSQLMTTTESPTSESTMNPTMDPTPSPTPHPTPAPTSQPTMSPSGEPTMEPTLQTPEPTNDPTLEPTLKPSRAPTTILVTEVPSKDSSYMATFYGVMITIFVVFLCVFGFVWWWKSRRDASVSRHRRLENALKGIEFRKVFKKPSGGEYSGLL